MDFAVPADHRIKLKESEKRIGTSILLGNWKTMEHEGDNYSNCDWCFWYSHQRIIKGTGELGGWRTSRNHPNYSIIENDQNTEKSPARLEETCCHSNSSEKPSAKTDLKNSQRVNIIIMMMMRIIPIVTSALGTVNKRLVQGLEDLEITGWVETIQTIALLRSARILRRVLEIWRDLLSLKLQWETIS